VIVVTDYGHGMFTDDLIERLCDEAPFLAVNVQSNAGNSSPISTRCEERAASGMVTSATSPRSLASRAAPVRTSSA
jgi:hypothetical protein